MTSNEQNFLQHPTSIYYLGLNVAACKGLFGNTVTFIIIVLNCTVQIISCEENQLNV